MLAIWILIYILTTPMETKEIAVEKQSFVSKIACMQEAKQTAEKVPFMYSYICYELIFV